MEKYRFFVIVGKCSDLSSLLWNNKLENSRNLCLKLLFCFKAGETKSSINFSKAKLKRFLRTKSEPPWRNFVYDDREKVLSFECLSGIMQPNARFHVLVPCHKNKKQEQSGNKRKWPKNIKIVSTASNRVCGHLEAQRFELWFLALMSFKILAESVRVSSRLHLMSDHKAKHIILLSALTHTQRETRNNFSFSIAKKHFRKFIN